jgi:putative endonuclease
MRELGDKGEKIAKEYLLSQGYNIIETNYASRKGEIDIIAKDQAVLCFVEVKYYKQGSLRDLHEAVDLRKQKKIIKTAEKYLFQRKIENCYTRFDVLLLSFGNYNEVSSVELLQDAFRG